MSNQYPSKGAGRPQPTDSQQQQQQQRRHRSTRHPAQETAARYGTTAELMAMVDEHLAWTTQAVRPTSQGTMIVDWDGTGQPIVSYRKTEPEEVPAAVQTRAPAPLRTASQTRVPSRVPSRPASSRIPVQGRQDPSAYKRKPLPAVPSVSDSMRELRQPSSIPSQAKHSRYDSVVSQARGQSTSKPLPPQPQAYTQPPRQPQPPTQPAPPPQPPNPNKYTTADGFTATYRPPRFSASLNAQKPGYVRGYDAPTEFEYGYDGNVLHVHRSSLSKRSDHSDYYAVDVEAYAPNAKLDVAVPEKMGEKEKGKHGSVVRFLERVLGKLEALGLMGKLRAERRASRKAESWKAQGYTT
jgi:hypothetical protein